MPAIPSSASSSARGPNSKNTKQELAAEKAKSLYSSNQIEQLCALDIVNEELEESRKDIDTYREAMLKRDKDDKLVKEQLEEVKEDEVVHWRMLTSRLRSLGKSHEMGRMVYDMLFLQVEGQYGEDKVVLERVKEALKEAFGGLF
ncbi:hypothetical protein G6011_01814 [Alternaria panax]|uniref:Uncharacterized protein n=1 Tax=Alternaria panax TaxID=48097 RepID=A0AAD4ILH7_9PLEO|nr:hypothetical protein G6011_01814 [Alternaria panax]